jgi:HpaII restriction endonuclease
MQIPITTTPQFIKLENLKLIDVEFECEVDSAREKIEITSISNRLLRLNLMLVDSKFPEILAEAALSLNTLEQCTLEQIVAELILHSQFSREYASRYYLYKINSFLQLLLYSNLATNDVCKGIIDSSRVYLYKTKQGDLHYFSIYDQNKLFNLIQQQCVCKSSIVTDAGSTKKVILTLRMPSHLL